MSRYSLPTSPRLCYRPCAAKTNNRLACVNTWGSIGFMRTGVVDKWVWGRRVCVRRDRLEHVSQGCNKDRLLNDLRGQKPTSTTFIGLLSPRLSSGGPKPIPKELEHLVTCSVLSLAANGPCPRFSSRPLLCWRSCKTHD